MPVSVNMPQMRQRDERDPLDTLLKGLNIAASVYGIKEASQKQDLLAKEMEMKATDRELLGKQRAEDRALKLAEGGFMLDPSGKIVENPESSIVKSRLRKQEPDSLATAIKQQTLSKMQADAEARQREAAEKIAGRPLPAGEALAVGGANDAIKAVGELEGIFSSPEVAGATGSKLTGGLSNLSRFTGIGESGKTLGALSGQLTTRAQQIGRFLEGGKMTDADVERYASKVLPTEFDPPDVREKKLADLKQRIFNKALADKQALAQSGYNVSNLEINMGKTNDEQRQADMRRLALEERKKQLLQEQSIKSQGLNAVVPRR